MGNRNRSKYKVVPIRKIKPIEIVNKSQLQYTNHVYERFVERIMKRRYNSSLNDKVEHYIQYDLRGSNIRRVVRIYNDIYIYTKNNREYRIDNHEEGMMVVVTVIEYRDSFRCVDIGRYRLNQKRYFDQLSEIDYINHKNKLKERKFGVDKKDEVLC